MMKHTDPGVGSCGAFVNIINGYVTGAGRVCTHLPVS